MKHVFGNKKKTSTKASESAGRVIEEQIASLELSDPDLQIESRIGNNNAPGDSKVSTSQSKKSDTAETKPPPFRFVPLRMGGNGRTHVSTPESAALVDEVGGVDALESMTEKFYEKAFADATLDKFIRSHDDPHGRRFATWIHQKLGGSGNLWDKDRSSRSDIPVKVAGGHHVTVHDRSSAHVAAWYSPKRPKPEVGRHFKLDECRVWMRLHFWAMREANLQESSPSFVDFYVRFIGHFIRVYESTAPMFARDAYRWSENPKNIERYIKDGYRMKDVLGVNLGYAMKQIPLEESEHVDWPYIVHQEQT